MEEVTSSSRAQESSTENKANISGSLNSTFSHQLVQNDSSEFSKERDSSSTNLAESTEKSSPPIDIETHSPESLQKLTDTDSLATSDLTSSNNLKENSSEELSGETNKQCVPSSSETWNKKSLQEIWTTDSEYAVSLRKFNETFTCVVDTVVDLAKYRACYSCAAGSNAGELSVESCDATNEQCLSSSTDSSNKKSIDEIWTTDCRYSDSLRKFRDALNRAADTVVDIINNKICSKCPSRFARHPMYLKCEPSRYDCELKELLSPLSPSVIPVLKDAAFLRAAQKGEGHAGLHLFKMGARGEATDSEKRNALHLACMGGWNRCVYILVDYKAIASARLHRDRRWIYRNWEPKADFEAVDIYLKTPLDYAMKDGNCFWSYLIEDPIELKQHQRERKKNKKS